ncbi:hypothetical protein EDB84DRAFT_1678717 [Lactarius hengduanensis]|nr:hypothetical protein EDB84DRAFT_1678717 [Lactarius hengduanensis]
MFLPSLARSAMNSQPESEHEAASTSMSVPLLSLPLSTLHPLSLLSSTFLPSPTQSVIVDHLVPELVSASSTPPSSLLFSIPPSMSYAHSPAPSSIDDDSELTFTHPASSVSSIDVECLHSPVRLMTDGQSELEPAPTSESQVSKFGLSPHTLPLPPDQTLPSLLPSPTLSSLPLLENSTLGSLPVTLSPDQSFESLLSEALGQSSKPCESESTLVSAAGVVPPRFPELSLCELLLYETIPLLPTQHEVSVAVPASRHSTPPQRSLGCKIISSVSSALDVTPPFALLIPRLGCRDSPLVYEAPSTRLPTLAPPSLLSLRLSSASTRFNFALSLIAVAALVSTLFNASTTLSAHSRKFWSKYEDIGNNQNGTLQDIQAHATFRASTSTRTATRPAPRASFSTQEARLQIQDYPRHTEDMPITGNPWVTQALPIPHPRETHTRAHGYGYGQISTAGLLYYKARCVIIAPRHRCIATADCRVVTVVVVAVFAAVVAAVVTAVVAVVAAIVVATVAAVVRRPWRRLAITPAAAVMGAAAVAFGTCVAMMLAVGRSAGAGEVVVVGCRLRRVMPVLFSSLLIPPICTRYQPPPPPCHRQQQDGVDDNDSDDNDNDKAARRRRHDELDDPPPPTGPCHRQRQDDVNNSNNADSNDADDDDDSDDDTDNNDKMTTTGHENNWT